MPTQWSSEGLEHNLRQRLTSPDAGYFYTYNEQKSLENNMSDEQRSQFSDRERMDEAYNETSNNEQAPVDRPIAHTDEDNVVDVRDLVYKGGFSKDPQEILGNPAVAPQMLSEGRDLRVDIFREAEEAVPSEEESRDE